MEGKEDFRTPLGPETPLRTEASGQVVLPRVAPGRYTLTLSDLDRNAYIADILEGGRSVFDDCLLVTSGQPSDVQVIVAPDGEQMTGTLEDASGGLIPRERVVLIPEWARRQNHSLFKAVLTDASGRFEFRGIAPGNYTLFGWSPSPQREAHLNAEFLSQ